MMASFGDILSNPNYVHGFTRITTGNSKGLLYVESPNDIGFWRYIIEHVCPGKYEVKAAAKLKANGKRTLELEYSKLHKNYIVGVDSDMDYLCPSRNEYATQLNDSSFVLHTFSYAKESLQCSTESIEDIMERLVYCESYNNEISETLLKLSHIIYDALTIHLFRHNSQPKHYHDGILWPVLKMPKNTTLINHGDLKENPIALTSLQEKLSAFIGTYNIMSSERDEFNAYVFNLNAKGLTPGTAYQFIKGHILHDDYVFPMLKIYRDKLCSLEKAKVGRECRSTDKTGEREVRIGEIDNFFNKTNVLETLLNNTLNYTNNPIYNRIKTKLRQLDT
ncbi:MULTISPECIES: DUF4435 domain-containing protein [Aeromonas]|uniref:DUF4435 domain-containing protein n=1 Tax=Aeromonas TaxID=642 RepID=UPI00030897A3|nr:MULTISPECIES: DUF4435 domain-containing protein [Aeromonas]MCF5852211.1 DUF4435 domain-containing protein [Aeromonas veronii]